MIVTQRLLLIVWTCVIGFIIMATAGQAAQEPDEDTLYKNWASMNQAGKLDLMKHHFASLSPAEQERMLKRAGVASRDDFFAIIKKSLDKDVPQYAWLKGIDSVGVFVNSPSLTEKKEDQLEDHIAAILEKTGLQVLDSLKAKVDHKPGMDVSVLLRPVPTADGLRYTAEAELLFYDFVSTSRQPRTGGYAITYRWVSFAENADSEKAVTQAIDELIEDFQESYEKANPKA